MARRSSSPDVPLVSLKGPPVAAHSKSESSVERSLDDKQDGQEHIQLVITPSASSASPSRLTDPLQPALTSVNTPKTPRPSHAVKRPPQVGSTHSSRSSSPSPQANPRRVRLHLRARGGKKPAGRGKGYRRGRGSEHPGSRTATDKEQSRSSSTNLTGVEETPKDLDGGAEPRKQTTRENSVDTDHGSRRSFPVSYVRETSMHVPSLSSTEPAIQGTSPRDSIIPDPTTLVSQLNMTNGHSQQQIPIPNLSIDPLSTAFGSHPYLNALEDLGAGVKFLGDTEQAVDGHFLESLTRGLYGPSTSSLIDSEMMHI